MIKVGVFYPQSKKFDWDYYLNTHTPMLGKLMGSALKKVEIEKGIAGGAPARKRPTRLSAICISTRSKRSRQRSARTRARSWAISRTTPTRSRLCRSAKSKCSQPLTSMIANSGGTPIRNGTPLVPSPLVTYR